MFGFKYAIKGLIVAFKSEFNLRIQLLIAFIVIAAGFICDISRPDWLVIVLCIGLVISLELINTALEALVNLISPGKNVLAGKIKDIGAAAVLVATLISVICGLIIFVPYLIR